MTGSGWLILSTRSKYDLCGEIWLESKRLHEVEHRIYEGEGDLLDAVEAGVFDKGYRRVIVDANLRRMGGRVKSLKCLPNLIVFDHDVCQHYCKHSYWHKKYIPVIKAIGARRAVVSSQSLEHDLRLVGVDAVTVLKGYDDSVIRDLGGDRDVSVGFVGRLSNRVYRERKKILQRLEREGDLDLTRTPPGEAYNQALNRIHVFVSADVGFNEYMIKNYEAMAAGCALLAWRQPDVEQEALGLIDGENVLLYSSFAELKDRIAKLAANPVLVKRIAQEGRRLVEKNHTWRLRGTQLAAAIERPLSGDPVSLTLGERMTLLGRL